LKNHGIEAAIIYKVSEGRPHVVDYIKNGDIQMVINTSVGRKSSRDAYHIRRGALTYNILYTTQLLTKIGKYAPYRSIIKNNANIFPLPLGKRAGVRVIGVAPSPKSPPTRGGEVSQNA